MDITNYLSGITANITSETQPKSIPATIVGQAFTDLANLTKTNIESVNAVVTGHTISIGSLSGQTSGNTLSINTLSGQTTGNTTSISGLNTTVSAHTASITVLQTGLTSAQSAISNNTALVGSLQTAVTGVTTTFTTQGDDGIVRLVDSIGNIATYFDLQGNQHLFKLFTNFLELGNMEVTETKDYEFAITDSSNNLLLKIDKDDVKLQGIFSSSASATTTYTKTSGQLFDIEYNPLYGQSLSVGTNGLPPLTTTQRYLNLMFKGGVRFWDASGNTQDLTAFVPAIENVSTNNAALGETAISGAMNMFIQSLSDIKGIAYNASDYDYALLGGTPGFGGLSISQLSKGSVYYTRFLASVTAGKALATAAGKTFGVRAIYWIQGDNDAGNTAVIYKAALKQLRTDLNTDIKAIVGVNQPDIPVIMYQFCQHNWYGANPTIGLCQLDIAKTEPGFYIANPGYFLEYSADNRHFSNYGNLHQGVYLGKAGFEHLINGNELAPFVAQSAKVFGTIAEVRFNPRSGQLRFDTSGVTGQTNMGFNIVDGGTGVITITSVAITKPDTIRFVFSRNIVAGDKLTYAQNGVKGSSAIADQSKGNLRDTAGDTIIYNPAGDNYKVHNWALMHDFTF